MNNISQLNFPNNCPICHSRKNNLKDTNISIADGTIFSCGVCHCYFLFPPMHVKYTGSGWSESRKAKWEYDIQRADIFAPAIMKYIEYYLDRPMRTVLELGCSTAYMGEGFRNIGCEYTGIDVDFDAIKFAIKNGIDAHYGTLEEVDKVIMPYNKYDLIISSNVFEHLEDPTQALRKLKSKCDGLLVIIVPNAHGLFHMLSANKAFRRLSHFIEGGKGERVYSIDGYWHNLAYTKHTLEYMCEKENIKPLKISSISINDPVFGFVQPNKSTFYQIFSYVAKFLSMDSQIILIAKMR